MALAVPPLTLASGWTWILPALRLARSPTVGAGSAAAAAVAPAISTSPRMATRQGALTACLHHPAHLLARARSPARARAPARTLSPAPAALLELRIKAPVEHALHQVDLVAFGLQFFAVATGGAG